MFDCIIFITGTAIITFAPNLYFILAGRYIQGHSTASARVAIPIYVGEISQAQIRKTTGSFMLLLYATSFALSQVLGRLSDS